MNERGADSTPRGSEVSELSRSPLSSPAGSSSLNCHQDCRFGSPAAALAATIDLVQFN